MAITPPFRLSWCISINVGAGQANTLRPEDADRLGINRQHCLNNLKILRENPQVREKVVAIFAEAEPFTPSDNVDAQLYNGFFSDADRAAMKIVLETEPRNLPALDITFVDKRIEKLLFNYRARNFPGTLDYAEQQRWLEHRRRSSRQSFYRVMQMNCRCWHNNMPMTKRKWHC